MHAAWWCHKKSFLLQNESYVSRNIQSYFFHKSQSFFNNWKSKSRSFKKYDWMFWHLDVYKAIRNITSVWTLIYAMHLGKKKSLIEWWNRVRDFLQVLPTHPILWMCRLSSGFSFLIQIKAQMLLAMELHSPCMYYYYYLVLGHY